MIISQLVERRAGADYDGYYIDSNPSLLMSLLPSSSGMPITVDTAMTYSAFYACVKVISETIAMLPLIVYRRLQPRGKERAPEHPLYNLLHDEPNPEMTSFQWRETMMQHLLTWGNHYSNIERANSGQILNLWPLRPDRMKPQRNDNGKIEYIYTLPNGEKRKLIPDEVLHIRGGSFDGIVGQSPVGQMREAIALGIGTENFGNEFYKNGLALSGILSHPGKLGDKAKKNLQESTEKYRTGMGNRHRFMVLEEGMAYTQIGIPPENAQFLETRKFQLEEMCRIFRLQLHKVQSLDKATFSNIEHQAIEFKVDTIQPGSTRIESDMNRQLLTPLDKKIYFIQFLLDGLLRGDIKTRYEAYGVSLKNGWNSVNDVRELENMNAADQEGADELYHENIWYKLGESPKDTQPTKPAPAKDTNAQRENEPDDVERRARLYAQYEPLFYDAASRIVRIEINDIRRAVDKFISKDDTDGFVKWLDEFYGKLPEKIELNMRPVLESYCRAVGGDARLIDKENAEYAEGYINNHRSQLVDSLGLDGSDTVAFWRDKLSCWEKDFPDNIAKNRMDYLYNYFVTGTREGE